jgi:putative FmdB family regulatory protein
MPIYEFACPKCRKIFNFLSKKPRASNPPACPKCGHRKMTKQGSSLAMPRGGKESSTAAGDSPDRGSMAGMDEARMMQVMSEMERDMAHLDENNPKHMAHLMRKMKDSMPAGSVPKELDVAIKRLEAGEDPEKIEADMGDILGDFTDSGEGGPGGAGSYTHDSGLYDY